MIRTSIVRLAALAAMLVAAASPARAFRCDSNFGVTATTPVRPTAPLPTRFIHWDLREFDSCRVPYSIDNAGCRDSLAGGGFAAIAASFGSWNATLPTPLSFVRQANVETNVAGNDNVNLIAFDSTDVNGFMGAAPSGTLALTYVWTQPATGRIQESDIVFNDRDWQWNNTGDDFLADTSTQAAPYAIGNGDSLYVRIDGGAVVGMRFDNTNITPGAATNQQVFNVISGALPNRLYGFGTVSGGIKLQSRRADGQGSIEIVAGTGNLPGALGFPAGRVFTRLADIQTVCTHEIGHFMGIAHSSDNGNEPDATARNAVMYAFAPPTGTKRALTPDDRTAMNFLYTPDDGDAPAGYPTPVHTVTNSRVLNGVQLHAPGQGPQHMFDLAGVDSLRFAWLGDNWDESECEAQMVNNDVFDDGVAIPSPMVRAENNDVTVTIHYGDPARFDKSVPGRTIYFNGYFDFNCDGKFDATDRQIWWSGDPNSTLASSPSMTSVLYNPGLHLIQIHFDVIPSLVTCNDFWTRFRLDEGEDEGRVANYNGDLGPAIGVAQFGEVEDYPAQAADAATPVLVSRFAASPTADAVTLTWSTPEGASPLVDLYRRLSPDGAETLIAHDVLAGANGARYVDTSVEPGASYVYRLVLHDAGGDVSGPTLLVQVPEAEASLAGAVPNPLSGAGLVRFSLPRAGHAQLALYSVAGRRLQVLAEGEFQGGAHSVRWDPARAGVAPGIYFIRLEAGGRIRNARVAVMR